MESARFFGAEARDRIERAVRDAEARSIGQLVPVVEERSAHYPETRWMGAVILAALATAAVEVAQLHIGLGELAFLQAAAGGAGALLARLGPVERLLAGKRALDAAVRARAERAFRAHDLHRTARGTGVLVFASLRERRALVLGDHGIDEKMGAGEWQRAVDALVAGIRRDDPAGGFCDAIALCGAKLAQHFPREGAPAPGNELPDRLRTPAE
jgi:putative membrane protein